jgi:hypothetical protein
MGGGGGLAALRPPRAARPRGVFDAAALPCGEAERGGGAGRGCGAWGEGGGWGWPGWSNGPAAAAPRPPRAARQRGVFDAALPCGESAERRSVAAALGAGLSRGEGGVARLARLPGGSCPAPAARGSSR